MRRKQISKEEREALIAALTEVLDEGFNANSRLKHPRYLVGDTVVQRGNGCWAQLDVGSMDIDEHPCESIDEVSLAYTKREAIELAAALLQAVVND